MGEAGGPGIRSLGPRSRVDDVGLLALVHQHYVWYASSAATANGADERIPGPPAQGCCWDGEYLGELRGACVGCGAGTVIGFSAVDDSYKLATVIQISCYRSFKWAWTAHCGPARWVVCGGVMV